MTRGFAKAMVNLYGIAFVLGGVAAAFHTKAVIGALVLLFAGVQLLRRRVSGVSVVMALAVLAGALGLLFAGMASWRP